MGMLASKVALITGGNSGIGQTITFGVRLLSFTPDKSISPVKTG
jgi:hypothetical protein